MQAIIEAINTLHQVLGPSEGKQYILTPDCCMVISIAQQLLVQILTKRMINLMTPEAIVLNHSKIPYFYLEHYLCSQAHFSLKEMITKYYTQLKDVIL